MNPEMFMSDELTKVAEARTSVRQQRDRVERLRAVIDAKRQADAIVEEKMPLIGEGEFATFEKAKPVIRAVCNAMIASIEAAQEGIPLAGTGSEGWPAALSAAEADLQKAEDRLAETEADFVQVEQARAQKAAQTALDGLGTR